MEVLRPNPKSIGPWEVPRTEFGPYIKWGVGCSGGAESMKNGPKSIGSLQRFCCSLHSDWNTATQQEEEITAATELQPDEVAVIVIKPAVIMVSAGVKLKTHSCCGV